VTITYFLKTNHCCLSSIAYNLTTFSQRGVVMNTLKTGGVFFLLILAGIFMMGCRDGNIPDEGTGTPIAVTFTDLIADGSSTAATTKLTLTFDKDIAGLAADDIDFTAGTTGTSKGSLTWVGMGGYELAVSGVTESGNVTVSVAKTGFSITGGPKSVTVYPAPSSGGPVAVVFNNLTANGSSTAATTKLTLTFDKDIADLSEADITFTAGTTGASKGSLTRVGTGVYELVISGVTANGSVTKKKKKTGFTITGGPKSVDIFIPNSPSGTKVTDWHELIAPGQTNATKYASFEGENDVLHVSPSNTAFGWAVLTYDLGAYAGKEITITLGMDVWLETAAKVAWQANLRTDPVTYPVIAGSTTTAQAARQWVSISGITTITVPADGGTLYLTNDASNGLNNAPAYITNFVLIIDDGSPPPVEGEILLTIGAKEDLTNRITTFNPSGRTLTWSSSNTNVASVANTGIVTAAGYTTGGTETASSAAIGTATITVTASGAAPNTETFTIKTTMVAQVNMMDLPPLKDQFASHFLIGNITRNTDISGGTINNTRLTRHYNVLTAENDMKPSYYGGSRNGSTVTGLTFYSPDAFVNAATASGFKVHAHVLLWHSQNSSWITAVANETKTTAIEAMQSYITQVVTRYKGKIYSWDVLNEVIPDGVSASANWKTAMRTTGDSQAPNPWFVAIGSDFVYEGFKAARLADPAAILYYNDYNMDSVGKSIMVANMVKDVNEAWKGDKQYDNRLLIEGIGMQSHHNTDVTANAIKTSLDRFRALGVKISISEIDVLCMSYSAFANSTGSGTNKSAQSIATNNQKLTAANLYASYMSLFIANADIIERVTFWGLNDNMSWRSGGLPLPFDGPSDNSTSKAKPAYYRIVDSLQ
jgi:GH35 family endo-1,4-beta-xylanase